VKDNVNNSTHKPRCLKIGLIVAGTLLILLSVLTSIISTYFLVIMTKTTTTGNTLLRTNTKT